jgi:hypothetical protein
MMFPLYNLHGQAYSFMTNRMLGQMPKWNDPRTLPYSKDFNSPHLSLLSYSAPIPALAGWLESPKKSSLH